MYINVANNSTNDGGDGGLSTGEIIAIVFGVIASIGVGVGLVVVIVKVVRWYLQRKRTRDIHQNPDAVDGQPSTGK